MSILTSIKQERRMSFNHWRYCLLHWTFNVRNPGCYTDTGLPPFLYTHYCPLFHLTNLIAILIPLILIVKFFCVVFGTIVFVVAMVDWEGFGRWLQKMFESNESHPAVPAPSKTRERKWLLDNLPGVYGDFEKFWIVFENRFSALSFEEVKAIFEEYYPKVEAARERQKERERRMRERLIFWTNFSRIFIKWALNIFYGGLALVALYLSYLAFWPVFFFFGEVLRFIGWLFTDSALLSILMLAGKLILYTTLTVVGFWFISQFTIVRKTASLFCRGMVAISLPFFIVPIFFRWVRSAITAILDFVLMFYDENCPPIVLITTEEGRLEKEDE